jgi:SAM-dependent methyltransferase
MASTKLRNVSSPIALHSNSERERERERDIASSNSSSTSFFSSSTTLSDSSSHFLQDVSLNSTPSFSSPTSFSSSSNPTLSTFATVQGASLKKRQLVDVFSPPTSPPRAQILTSNFFPVTPPPAHRPQISSSKKKEELSSSSSSSEIINTRLPAFEPTLAQSALYDPVLASLNKFEKLGCCHDGTQTSLYGELTPRCVRVIIELFRKYGMRGVFDTSDDNETGTTSSFQQSQNEKLRISTTRMSQAEQQQQQQQQQQQEEDLYEKNRDTFLDIGCGLGKVVFAASIFAGVRAYGVEIVPSMVRVARLVNFSVLFPLRAKERRQRRIQEKNIREKEAEEKEAEKKEAEKKRLDAIAATAALPSLARVGCSLTSVGSGIHYQSLDVKMNGVNSSNTLVEKTLLSSASPIKRGGSLVSLTHLSQVAAFTPMKTFSISRTITETETMMPVRTKLDFSNIKMNADIDDYNDHTKETLTKKIKMIKSDKSVNSDDSNTDPEGVADAVAAAIAAAVKSSRNGTGKLIGDGHDESCSPPRINRIKPLNLTVSAKSLAQMNSSTKTSTSFSLDKDDSFIQEQKKMKRHDGDSVKDSSSPSPLSSSSRHRTPPTVSSTPVRPRTMSVVDKISPGWQEEEAEEDSEVDDKIASSLAFKRTPPPPSFCLADASLKKFWIENMNKFTHIYAFDPAFPGKDLLPPSADGPSIDDGIDVLGGIASGLNSSTSWKVLISFQPPRVWQRKGLLNARCVQRVTQMHMRVSGESKTCFVYLRDETCGNEIQVADDLLSIQWRG